MVGKESRMTGQSLQGNSTVVPLNERVNSRMRENRICSRLTSIKNGNNLPIHQ